MVRHVRANLSVHITREFSTEAHIGTLNREAKSGFKRLQNARSSGVRSSADGYGGA
jgi:hypothetical protein